MHPLARIPRDLFVCLAPPRCPGCDQRLSPSEPAGFCVVCAPLIEEARFGSACFEYGGPLAEAVRALKYLGRWRVAEYLGGLMVPRALRLYRGRVDAVVPIPLHRKRLRTRGYNQAELLARPVARMLRVPVRRGLLERVKAGRPQVGVGRSERALALRGAFAATESGWPPRVLILDDVRTTGATLDAATAAIKAAQPVTLHRLTLAVTVADDVS